MFTDSFLTATIPVFALGEVHHSEWRHRGTVARRAIVEACGWMDEAWCYEMLSEFFFFFSTFCWREHGDGVLECTTESCDSPRHHNY